MHISHTYTYIVYLSIHLCVRLKLNPPHHNPNLCWLGSSFRAKSEAAQGLDLITVPTPYRWARSFLWRNTPVPLWRRSASGGTPCGPPIPPSSPHWSVLLCLLSSSSTITRLARRRRGRVAGELPSVAPHSDRFQGVRCCIPNMQRDPQLDCAPLLPFSPSSSPI